MDRPERVDRGEEFLQMPRPTQRRAAAGFFDPWICSSLLVSNFCLARRVFHMRRCSVQLLLSSRFGIEIPISALAAREGNGLLRAHQQAFEVVCEDLTGCNSPQETSRAEALLQSTICSIWQADIGSKSGCVCVRKDAGLGGGQDRRRTCDFCVSRAF